MINNLPVFAAAAAAPAGNNPFDMLRSAGGTIFDQLVLLSWVVALVAWVVGGLFMLFGSEAASAKARRICLRVTIGVVLISCAKPFLTFVGQIFGAQAKF